MIIEIEDAALTLARLLKTNLRVIKDNDALANVNVTNEWQSNEALKGHDGQVTVSVVESFDQKLDLCGKIRRRTATLRVNVWTSEQPNISEPARVMRSKIIEEVNNVIRQNRNCPNQTLYSFYGIGPLAQTQKAYRRTSEALPDAAGWFELSGPEYQQLWGSDDNHCQASASAIGEYAVLLFGFKTGSREKTAQKIVFSFEGYGIAPSGDGVTVKAWNHKSSGWDSAQSGGTGGNDGIVTVALVQDLPNYIDDKGYVWFLARTSGVSDGVTPAVLNCDYVGCTVTVRGITYCDVVSYRDADRVDVKPFIFCTEFTVKSWFFENIGV